MALEPLVEALAADEFHLDERIPIGQHIGVVNGDDMGMRSRAIALASRLNRCLHCGLEEISGTMVFKARSVSSFKCRTR